jgi:hypothetical protein
MIVCNLEYNRKNEQPLIRLFQNVVGRLGGFLRLLIRLMIPYFSEGTSITTALIIVNLHLPLPNSLSVNPHNIYFA